MDPLKRFILPLVFLFLQGSCNLFVDGVDSLSPGSSLRGKQTIILKNGTFELGFFNPNGTNNWYVGIWYAQIPDKTIIWVANRETPIKNMPGIFSLSTSGYLIVSDLQGDTIWSSNDTQQTQASIATIQDSGNFVLLGAQNISKTVWESFAYPTYHFMPTMKLWKGMKVNSWKSSMDPVPAPFFLQMNPSPGKKDFLQQYKNGVSYYTSGDWTGKYYSSMPQAVSDTSFKQELVEFSPTRFYYVYDLTRKVKVKATTMVRNVLNTWGELTVYFLINNTWSLVYYSPVSDCAMYGLCRAYGVCSKQETI